MMNDQANTKYWEVFVDQTERDGFTELSYKDSSGETRVEPISNLLKQVNLIRRNNGINTQVIVYR